VKKSNNEERKGLMSYRESETMGPSFEDDFLKMYTLYCLSFYKIEIASNHTTEKECIFLSASFFLFKKKNEVYLCSI
jgi:hypothetical protein